MQMNSIPHRRRRITNTAPLSSCTVTAGAALSPPPPPPPLLLLALPPLGVWKPSVENDEGESGGGGGGGRGSADSTASPNVLAVLLSVVLLLLLAAMAGACRAHSEAATAHWRRRALAGRLLAWASRLPAGVVRAAARMCADRLARRNAVTRFVRSSGGGGGMTREVDDDAMVGRGWVLGWLLGWLCGGWMDR